MSSASAGGLGSLSRTVRWGRVACSIASSASASVTDEAAPVSLAGKDETRGEPVLPAEDAKRVRRAVGILHVDREGALHRRAEEIELAHAFRVRRLDVLDLLGVSRHGEERAAEAKVVASPVLADVAAPGGPDDLRREHASGAGELRQLDPLRVADIYAARADVAAELRRRELRRPLPARVTPR